MYENQLNTLRCNKTCNTLYDEKLFMFFFINKSINKIKTVKSYLVIQNRNKVFQIINEKKKKLLLLCLPFYLLLSEVWCK